MKDHNYAVGGLVWIVILPLVYVLSSGPALLLDRTPVWSVVEVLYWPLERLAATKLGPKILLPYWDFWYDRQENPLIPG